MLLHVLRWSQASCCVDLEQDADVSGWPRVGSWTLTGVGDDRRGEVVKGFYWVYKDEKLI